MKEDVSTILDFQILFQLLEDLHVNQELNLMLFAKIIKLLFLKKIQKEDNKNNNN